MQTQPSTHQKIGTARLIASLKAHYLKISNAILATFMWPGLILVGFMFLGGCAMQNTKPIVAVPQVDLAKFMGDWFVIACIPTFIEKEAYNAVESYKLEADGTIDTTFTFNKGSLDGPVKRYNPHGFVVENTNNAVWGMQFIWPIKSEYIIAHLEDDYSNTIVARNARDYVWIMARTPSIPEAKYAQLTKLVADMGYDLAKLRKVPQQALQRELP